MSKQPSRIDLLELDIDLRLADLWREAPDDHGVESRRRRRLHAGRVRQGLLRRAHRGSARLALPRPRLPGPGARARAAVRAAASSRDCRSPRRGGLRCPREIQPCQARDRPLGGRCSRLFIVYTSIAGTASPQITPSDGRRASPGNVMLVGTVVGRPNRRRACTRRHALHAEGRQGSQGRARAGRLPRHRPRSLPDGPRDRRRRARCGTATFVAKPGSLSTKCPSKYTPAKSARP